MATILVIEDDFASRDLLNDALSEQGHEVLLAASGAEGLRCLPKSDLVVLEVMLPGASGLELATEIRRDYPTLPILMATALSTTKDKLAGFDKGADDYITKPYDLDELSARIQALLRRSGRAEVIRCGGLILQAHNRTASLADEPLDLTRLEFDLLLALARRPDTALARKYLLNTVWGPDFSGTERVVDVAIAAVRRKLQDDPQTPRFIRSVRGIGYLFRCEAR